MRRTLGTAVFGGMIGVTLFGIVLTPVFFFTIDWLGESRLFASRLARFLSRVSLDIVSMRPVRKAAAVAVHRFVAHPVSRLTKVASMTNGQDTARNGQKSVTNGQESGSKSQGSGAGGGRREAGDGPPTPATPQLPT